MKAILRFACPVCFLACSVVHMAAGDIVIGVLFSMTAGLGSGLAAVEFAKGPFE